MISVDRPALLSAVTACSKAAARNSTHPLLSNARLVLSKGTLSCFATDFEIGIRVSIPADGEPADIALDPREFSSALSGLQGDTAKIKPNGSALTVKGDGARSFKVRILDGADFPDT